MVSGLTGPDRGVTHRQEIDGLRAIAVSGVILDHAGVPGFSAGFAGVDIFFVISGFLIGGIVLRALAEGRFSFRTFYARRARRILPALFVMILVTLPFALMLMIPRELRHYCGGAFATLLFLSNVWFRTGSIILPPRPPLTRCCIPGALRWKSSSIWFCRWC